ncbi:MAG: hypothetical protein ABI790_11125 [Betaproteobacteria bacterium]
MRRLLLRYMVISYSCLMPATGFSYDLFTHGAMTNQAYELSKVGRSPATLSQLGLFDLPAPFNSDYYDFSGLNVGKRIENSCEVSKMLAAERPNRLRIRG